jgi:hypothetical protein
MTRFQMTTVPFSVVLGLSLATLPAAAQPGGTHKTPRVQTASPKGAPKLALGGHGHGGQAVAPKTTGAKAPAKMTTGSSNKAATAKAPKKSTTGSSNRTAAVKAPKNTTGSARTATAAGANSGATGPSIGSSNASAGSNSSGGSATTLSKAQQQLTNNHRLRQKIESRLPAGSDAIACAAGFRNLGQFEAAVNASHNQGYSFEALKALMTGPEQLSLGQAKKRLSTSAGTPPAGANATNAGTPAGSSSSNAGTTTGATRPGAGTPSDSNATNARTPAGSSSSNAGTATGSNSTAAAAPGGSNNAGAGATTSRGTPSTGTNQAAKSKTRTPGGR